MYHTSRPCAVTTTNALRMAQHYPFALSRYLARLASGGDCGLMLTAA